MRTTEYIQSILQIKNDTPLSQSIAYYRLNWYMQSAENGTSPRKKVDQNAGANWYTAL